jgi:hypothetical protein
LLEKLSVGFRDSCSRGPCSKSKSETCLKEVYKYSFDPVWPILYKVLLFSWLKIRVSYIWDGGDKKLEVANNNATIYYFNSKTNQFYIEQSTLEIDIIDAA